METSDAQSSPNPITSSGETPGHEIDDIEEQYRRAVEAMDDADWELPADSSDDDVLGELPDVEKLEADEPDLNTEPPAATGSESDSVAAAHSDEDREAEQESGRRFTPRQILESALFVGGDPLSSKRLAGLLGDRFDSGDVQELAEDLNRTYVEEARPYEIRLGEGGYRLVLREKYNSVRNRVFGGGPREVRLSQDVLEVLALVAYQQPLTRDEVNDYVGKNAGSMLSQLVRRELLAIHRDEEDAKRVYYQTTPRFLSLFSLGGLDELPQADALGHK